MSDLTPHERALRCDRRLERAFDLFDVLKAAAILTGCAWIAARVLHIA